MKIGAHRKPAKMLERTRDSRMNWSGPNHCTAKISQDTEKEWWKLEKTCHWDSSENQYWRKANSQGVK